MLSKVSLDIDEVNVYCSTLKMTYPVRKITQVAQTKAPTKSTGKKKVTGGPSGPKLVKKRKASEQTPVKRTQPKRIKKQVIVDEPSESENTISEELHGEEEEEHHSSLIHDTRPPSPPSTTTSLTSTIHTTSSDVPTISTTTETPHTSTTQTSEPMTSTIETPNTSTTTETPPISITQTTEPIITSTYPLYTFLHLLWIRHFLTSLTKKDLVLILFLLQNHQQQMKQLQPTTWLQSAWKKLMMKT